MARWVKGIEWAEGIERVHERIADWFRSPGHAGGLGVSERPAPHQAASGPGMLEREVESGVSFTLPTGDEVCPSRRELPPWQVNRLLNPGA